MAKSSESDDIKYKLNIDGLILEAVKNIKRPMRKDIRVYLEKKMGVDLEKYMNSINNNVRTAVRSGTLKEIDRTLLVGKKKPSQKNISKQGNSEIKKSKATIKDSQSVKKLKLDLPKTNGTKSDTRKIKVSKARDDAPVKANSKRLLKNKAEQENSGISNPVVKKPKLDVAKISKTDGTKSDKVKASKIDDAPVKANSKRLLKNKSEQENSGLSKPVVDRVKRSNTNGSEAQSVKKPRLDESKTTKASGKKSDKTKGSTADYDATIKDDSKRSSLSDSKKPKNIKVTFASDSNLDKVSKISGKKSDKTKGSKTGDDATVKVDSKSSSLKDSKKPQNSKVNIVSDSNLDKVSKISDKKSDKTKGSKTGDDATVKVDSKGSSLKNSKNFKSSKVPFASDSNLDKNPSTTKDREATLYNANDGDETTSDNAVMVTSNASKIMTINESNASTSSTEDPRTTEHVDTKNSNPSSSYKIRDLKPSPAKKFKTSSIEDSETSPFSSSSESSSYNDPLQDANLSTESGPKGMGS